MKKTINRSAKTGKFVTEAKAKRSPKTTVKETVKDKSYLKKEISKCINNIQVELKVLNALFQKL